MYNLTIGQRANRSRAPFSRRFAAAEALAGFLAGAGIVGVASYAAGGVQQLINLLFDREAYLTSERNVVLGQITMLERQIEEMDAELAEIAKAKPLADAAAAEEEASL